MARRMIKPDPHPLPTDPPKEAAKVYIPVDLAIEQRQNGMPAAALPKYAKIGIDGIMAMEIGGWGYLVLRTHETPSGPVARVSIITYGEASNFED